MGSGWDQAGEPAEDVDLTCCLAEDFQVTRPYLFVDVEPYIREGICDLREDLSSTCNALWHQDAVGEGSASVELPDSAVPVSVRGAGRESAEQAESLRASLKRCQLADDSLGPILRAKLQELDPQRAPDRKGD